MEDACDLEPLTVGPRVRIPLWAFICVVLSCVSRGLEMGPSSLPGKGKTVPVL
jgi:hypothetical protein